MTEHIISLQTALTNGHLELEKATVDNNNVIGREKALSYFTNIIVEQKNFQKEYFLEYKRLSKENVLSHLASFNADFEEIIEEEKKVWKQPISKKYVLHHKIEKLHLKIDYFLNQIKNIIYEEIDKREYYFIQMIFIYLLANILMLSIVIYSRYHNNKLFKTLKKSEASLADAQKTTHIGSYEFNVKTQTFIASDETFNIMEIEDKESFNSYNDFISLLHSDDVVKFENNYFDSIKNKTNTRFIYRVVTHKNKNIKYIEKRSRHIFDDFGNHIKTIGTLQDITKQYKAQKEVNRLKMVIENSPISIVVTDIDANITYVNPWFCKVTGYNNEEILGKNPNILKSGYTKYQEYTDLWNTITNKKNWSGIFKNKRKNGQTYWESATIVPIDDENGKIINYLGIKQEITEEVRLKAELANKEELMIAQSRHAAMGEMIGMIAHQWRQPLSVIAMGANNLIVDVELNELNEENIKEETDIILKQTEHLSKTIDDFRNFFRQDKEKEEVKLGDVMKEALQIIGKSLENMQISFSLKHSDRYTIKTYSRELLQVYINILKNAKESLAENKESNRHIDIDIKSDGAFMITSIYDNGSGIDEQIIEKIFQPYFTTKDEKTGTGLGLYMSKTIIEKHLLGKIKAYNHDKGACFEITLPIK